ncbi:hypothetical protein MKW94_024847 [Papaver nudicaule]|uniref:Uncharacterized protein n=1 Tax=Papaver nudicaule TaxID=74823 RepID=A0AA41RTM3_PAPNU|nr:hypothetical protein [Papaver nudicaule]
MDMFISKRRMQPAVVLAVMCLLIGLNLLVNINSVCSSMDAHEVNNLKYMEKKNIGTRKLLRTMSKPPPSPQANRQRIWQTPPGPPPDLQ